MTRTQIMGIVNVTPDSFYDGGRYNDPDSAVAHALDLIEQGADILDIGGESSRPGADSVTVEEELSRVIPVIQMIRKESSIPISIDTVKPEVAKASLEAGAGLINDISGLKDPRMRAIAAEYQIPVCLMHMQGTPKTMQSSPHYPEGIVRHLMQWFERQIESLLEDGIQEDKIILDPGIGFGKTVDDNFTIIQNLQQFRMLGFPILLGISRKSFMFNTLKIAATDVLATTISLNTIGILEGVEMIRVHDVREHRKVVDLLEKFFVR